MKQNTYLVELTAMLNIQTCPVTTVRHYGTVLGQEQDQKTCWLECRAILLVEGSHWEIAEEPVKL